MGGNSAAGKELGNQHPDRQRLSITAADTNRSTLPPPVTKHAPRLQKSFWSAGMTSACREEGYFPNRAAGRGAGRLVIDSHEFLVSRGR